MKDRLFRGNAQGTLLRLDEDWKELLDEGSLGTMKGRVDDSSDTSLDGANFSHLTRALRNSSISTELPFDKSTKTHSLSDVSEKKRLKNIRQLRNDVAHRRLILTDEKLNSEPPARDIKDLDFVYRDIIWKIRRKALIRSPLRRIGGNISFT